MKKRFKVNEVEEIESAFQVFENGSLLEKDEIQSYLDGVQAALESVPACSDGIENVLDVVRHVCHCHSCRTFARWLVEAHAEQFQPRKPSSPTPTKPGEGS